EGVGSDGFAKGFDIPKDAFLKIAHKKYEANYQTAVSLLAMTEKFSIGMVSALEEQTLHKFGIKLCDNVEVFLAGALEKHAATRVGVVPYGNSTLLKVRQGD
ncbi:MAG: hypothetical protein ABIA59_02870, partial [Candidatus Latescibacterota bacterium]